MHPVNFPESNRNYKAPDGMDESQVGTVAAYIGPIESGNLDGAPVIVTAWQPSAEDLERLNQGGAVFLSILASGLPPHMLTTSFKEATLQG